MGNVFLAYAAIVLTAPVIAADKGQVTLPLSEWISIVDEVSSANTSLPSPVPVCPIERRIEGRFQKGLLRATLVARFEVLDAYLGHVRVPIIDSLASVSQVTLDGQRTSLLSENGLYTVGVNSPGVHEVRLTFFWGKEQDRFARRISFRLPEAGATFLEISVPETEVEPQLDHGAFSAIEVRERETVLRGHLDATGLFELSWARRLTHRAQTKARSEMRLHSLFSIREAMVTSVAAFDIEMLDGETDRIDLQLPPGIEITAVEGDAVLQWRTEAREGGRLTILLRYLVEDYTRIVVHFQFPIDVEKPIVLIMPYSTEGIPISGALGVQGPAGLHVTVNNSLRAAPLPLRDAPAMLSDLTESPLLLAFTFTEPPQVTLKVVRNASVEVTSSMIDEMQSSTVVIADGKEVTKIRLRLRNNARQYLTLRLPPGSVLTHSLIDGQPIRPAVSTDSRGEILLIPMRQSEKISDSKGRMHVVQSGETLSDIANFYYSDPDKWKIILDRNQLDSAYDLVAGQQLRIPRDENATVEESVFVVELAYTNHYQPLSWNGRLGLTLPEVDIETLKATWHLYLPKSIYPINFHSNLTQYSAIRYDIFRRIRDFLGRVWGYSNAWAKKYEKGSYENILTKRKVIYQEEVQKRAGGEEVLSSFPLVGERYRFKRILLGSETPQIAVRYLTRSLIGPIRWISFIIAWSLVSLLLFVSLPRYWVWIIMGTLAVLLFGAGYYVLGVHRRVLWGIDAALILRLLSIEYSRIYRGLLVYLREPWLVFALVSLRNLAVLFAGCLVLWIVLAFPLLLSTMVFIALFLWWHLYGRAIPKLKQEIARPPEVSHE